MALERARQMDRALAAGLPRRLLVALVAARRRLWGGDVARPDDDVAQAVAHPAAGELDEVLVQRIQKRQTPGLR